MTISDEQFARSIFGKFKREWDNVESQGKTGERKIMSVVFYEQTETYTTNPFITVRLGDEYNGHVVTAIDVVFFPQRSPDITFTHENSAITVLPNVKLASYHASLYI